MVGRAEKLCEAGAAVESGPAQPVNRAAAGDERGRLAVADEGVILDPACHASTCLASRLNPIYRRLGLLKQVPTEAILSKLLIVDLGRADAVSRQSAQWSKKWPFVQTHGGMRRLLPMASLSEARIEVLTDSEALPRRAADWLLAAAAGKDRPFA